MSSYDAIVIGAGSAGSYMAARLADAGMKVAIVERKFFGGTCVNTGCTPTKAMVASAYAAHMARRAADFGVAIDGGVRVDMKRVKARKDAIVDRSRKSVEAWLEGKENCTVHRGQARFQSAREVNVDGETLRADKIFLDLGGRPAAPPIAGLDKIDYFTSDSIMDVDYLPPRLVVVGGSYIGLEFAQMFRRFGSEVTVVEMAPRLIPHEDEAISAAIREILEAEGVAVRVEAKCIKLGRRGGETVVGLECAGGPPEVTGSHLLLATGRRPNTDEIGPEKAGVEIDKRGYIAVDERLRTTASGIWAMGDCNGRGAFTHTAYNDYQIVAANLLDNEERRVSDRILAYALYIDPPLGRAGLTEEQVRASGRPALIGQRPMTRVARAVEKGETQGFMKILVAKDSKEILGAAILGTGGDEAIHCVLDVMYAKAPYAALERAVHIHPTVSELIPTMLEELRPL